MVAALVQTPTKMSSISNPSAQLSVVLKWYGAISTWQFDVLEALLSDDYIHKTLPASANDPPKNKAKGIEHAKSIAQSLGYTHLEVRRALHQLVNRNHVLCYSTRDLPIE